MLDAGSEDMAFIASTGVTNDGLADSPNGEVVGLGPAGNKHDLIRPGAHECRHLASCLIHRRAGLLAEVVDAGRIAKLFSQVRHDARSRHSLAPGRMRSCLFPAGPR